MEGTFNTSSKFLTGLFIDPIDAEKAYDAALKKGYKKEDISVFMSDDTKKKNYSHLQEGSSLANKVMEGAGVGGAIGTATGAIAAAIAAVGTSLAIPGLGLIIAGPIAAALAGAGAGGIAGSVLGALINAGFSEDKAKEYEDSLASGGIVIGIHPLSEVDQIEIENSWKEYGGTNFVTK